MSDNRLIIYCLSSLSMIIASCSSRDSSPTQQASDSNIQTSYLKTALGKKYFKREKGGGYIEVGYLVEGQKHGPIRYYTNGVLIKVSIFNRDSLVLNGDLLNFDYETIELDGGVTIDVPKTWTFPNDHPENLLTIISIDSSTNFLPNLIVQKDSLPRGMSLSQYVSEVMHQLKLNYPEFKVLYERKFTQGSFQGQQTVFMFRNGNDRITCVYTYYNINELIYFITGTALVDEDGRFIEFKCVFEEVGVSLKPI